MVLDAHQRQAEPIPRHIVSPEKFEQLWQEYQQKQERIDLNTANLRQLRCLPGIGEAYAEAILQYRTENGGFTCAEELLRIDGFTEEMLAVLYPQITVGAAAQP